MKTLKFIGLAIAVILLGVNFTSCSKEEEPKYNLITGEKKLTKICRADSNSSEVRTFTYDNEGKLLEATYNGEYTAKYTYIWKNNEINKQYGLSYIYTLSNGLVRNYDNYMDFSYDSEQQLSKIEPMQSYCDYYSIVWNSSDGTLSRVGRYYKEQNSARLEDLLKFFYNREDLTTCKGYNPIVPIWAGLYDDDICATHPELVGARTNILPTTFEREYYFFDNDGRRCSETKQGTFSYKYDNDGYIIECIMSEKIYDDYFSETKYTMTWE